jgi:cell division septation protein DedD
MKKGGLKEKTPLIFGRGIIIVAILIPATLSFILGYFVGKSITKESPEMKQFQEIQSNTIQPLETQSQQQSQSQSQVSEPVAGKELQPTESQNKTAKESQKTQKPAATLYTVQVGAFKNVADADALKKKLEKKGYRTSMALSESKKAGGLYKVWVGKFSTRKEAEALSMKIKKTESLQAFVTVKKEESIRQP